MVVAQSASGTQASVALSGATEGDTLTVTLEDGNSQGTALGMAGGTDGTGNAIPRTLTIESSAAEGTFAATVELALTDSDLATADVTDEQIGMYTYDTELDEWVLAGMYNVGEHEPTGDVGDFGFYTDADGNTVCWVIVNHFSQFAAGELYTYTLNTTGSPSGTGSVSVVPMRDYYTEGMQVVVTAWAGTGYEFLQWTGDVSADQEDVYQITITMDQDRSLTAYFDEPIPTAEYVLDVSVVEGVGGTVTIDPVMDYYPEGTQVSLSATAEDGYVFVGWEGDATGESAFLVFTITRDLEIAAYFESTAEPIEWYHLTVDVADGGGSVTVSPEQTAYQDGLEVTLTAEPDAGYVFDHWGGDFSGTGATLTFTVDGEYEAIAYFEPIPTPSYQLTVEIAPTAGGRVTLPSELTEFESGEQVTITAWPFDGYEFVEWGGDVDSTENPLTVTVTDDLSLTAQFRLIETDGETTSRGPCGTMGMITLPMMLAGLMGMRRRRNLR